MDKMYVVVQVFNDGDHLTKGYFYNKFLAEVFLDSLIKDDFELDMDWMDSWRYTIEERCVDITEYNSEY